MKIISRHTHGLLDYPIGVLLFFLPELLGSSGISDALVWLPRISGAAIFLQALITDYELGVIKLIPMKLHLYTDYVLGALLIASPWLFNLRVYPARFWLPLLLIGLFVLATSAVTDPRPVHRRVAAGV